ncbi:hypothetical protein GGF46_003926 [Coemansia sp. RSA 552]|nr:hypothetical protein GGF46_003926 [Coemansia sp. RSA 552]
MSKLDSDSEIEEIRPAPKPTPRVVRRPVPVRAKGNHASGAASTLGGAGVYDSASDTDDEDFFRLCRPNDKDEEEEEEARNTQPSDSGHRDAGRATPATPVADIVDVEDSEEDSESAEEYGEQSPASSVGEKRKHTDNGSQPKRARSRSVSLTPPPGQPAEQDSDSDESVVYTVDDELSVPSKVRRPSLDIDGLDPALQAVIRSREQSDGLSSSSVGVSSPNAQADLASRTRSGALEKVQVEFQFIYDDEFLSRELGELWEQRRWGRVTVNSPARITKKLNERIAVVVYTTDLMEKALAAFASVFVVDVLATDPVLMNRTMRVFPTSSLGSLGDKLAYYLKVYPRSVYNRYREHEALEQAKLAMEREQVQRDLELVRVLRQNATEADDALDHTEEVGKDDGGAVEEAPGEAGIRIKIRDKDGKDTLLRVAPTATIGAVIANYRKLAGISEGVAVVLEFDDEALDPDDVISSTEIEDDDMLTAFWR